MSLLLTKRRSRGERAPSRRAPSRRESFVPRPYSKEDFTFSVYSKIPAPVCADATDISLVGGSVGRGGVLGVAVASASSRVDLETARAVSTEVVKISGISPVGIDGSVVVEGTLVRRGIGGTDNVVEVVIEVGVDVGAVNEGGPYETESKKNLKQTRVSNLSHRSRGEPGCCRPGRE